MMKTRYFVCLLFLSSCDGCGKSGATTNPDAAAPSPSTTPQTIATPSAASGQPPWAAVPSATAYALPSMGLAERFQLEASSRPPGIKPNVEETWKALEKAGLALIDKKQHLASQFGARYCVGARLPPQPDKTDETMLYLSACEVITPELAKTAAGYSEKTLASVVPNRVIFTNKNMMLIVKEEQKTPEADAALDKAKAAFAAL